MKTPSLAIIITDRANWGRLLPVAERIRHNGMPLHIICGGSSTLPRFKCPADDIEKEGYSVSRIYNEIEGNMPLTMAMSLGHGCAEYAVELQRCKPDVVLIIGDRYQALGAACAAATLRIPIVHLQGGEVSGALDERYRHAVTKLADYHVPATQQAKLNLLAMGETEESILTVGCPASDLAKRVTSHRGESIVCAYHPDTSKPGDFRLEMTEILKGLERLRRPVLCLWPNIDAYSDEVAKAIRAFGERTWLETVKNLPPFGYMQALASAALCVGNSSSFVRDSSFFGTPVLLVGTRQDGREHSQNVTVCHAVERHVIAEMAAEMLRHGRYPPSDLYGDGNVSERIVAALTKVGTYRHKRLQAE